jgi:hypothetical protein
MITLTKLPPSYNIFTQVIQMGAAQAGSKGHDLKIKNVHAAIIQTFEAPSGKNKDNGQANKVTAIKRHTGTPTFQQQHQQQRPSGSSTDSSAQNSGRGRGNGQGRGRGRVHCGTRAGKKVREKSQQDTLHVANVAQDFPKQMAVDGPRDERMHCPVSTPRNDTILHTELWRAINLLKRWKTPCTAQNLRSVMDFARLDETPIEPPTTSDQESIMTFQKEIALLPPVHAEDYDNIKYLNQLFFEPDGMIACPSHDQMMEDIMPFIPPANGQDPIDYLGTVKYSGKNGQCCAMSRGNLT